MRSYQVGDIALYNEQRVKIIHLFKIGEHGIEMAPTCVVQYLDVSKGSTYQVINYGFSSPPNCDWLYEHQLTKISTPRGNPPVPKEESK